VAKHINKLFFIGCLLLQQFLLAQTNPKKDFILSGQANYGFIISHRNNMSQLIKGYVSGAELNYMFRTDGGKPWQQIHNYPEIGVGFLYVELANHPQLGHLMSLYPFTNIRLNKQNKKFNLNLRLGTGLAYITKPFDITTNPKNIVIGSYLNGFVNLRLSASFILTEAWRIDAGIGLTHASNGSFSTPNLGLNMATANLGVGYVFGKKPFVYLKDKTIPLMKTWEPSVIAVAGIKEMDTPDGPKYFAYGLQGNLYKKLNYKHSVGAGLDMSYNNATKQAWVNDSVYTNKLSDILQVGAKIGYSFNMHRLSLPVDFGVYLYKKQDDNGLFFHRIGLRYMVTKSIIANITLRTHWATADYFEWGIGYRF
jgi:hypothetical protein